MKKRIVAGILFTVLAVGLFGSGNPDEKTTENPTRAAMDEFIGGFDMNLEFESPDLKVYYAPKYDKNDEWDGMTLEEVDKFRLVAQDIMEEAADGKARPTDRSRETDRMNKNLLPGMWVKFDYEGKTYLRVILANVDVFVEDLSDSGGRPNVGRRPFNVSDPVFVEKYESAQVVTEPVRVNIPGNSGAAILEFYESYLKELNLGVGPDRFQPELFYLHPREMRSSYFRSIRKEVNRALSASVPEEMILDGSVFGEWLPMSRADGVDVMRGPEGISLSITKWPHDDRVCNGF